MIRCYKRDLASRLAKTRQAFGRRLCIVDIHSHSVYSDGRGTVDEYRDRAKHAGLDFLFVTDHGSLRQKRAVRKWRDVSWGQEPGAGLHHVGLLCGKRLFHPKRDTLAADYDRAKRVAPFVWIPHPVGWYPGRWYSDEAVRELWTLGDAFAVEVMNGAHKLVRAYDAFDAKAVDVWDRLLSEGKKVTALGASDAHGPNDIGTVWTGLFAPRCTAPSIIRALDSGLCFASEASVMDFSCNGHPMGSTVSVKVGCSLRFRFRVVDADGIGSVRVVSRGKVMKEMHTRGRSVVEGTWKTRAGNRCLYYRLESTASDDRRAFSTPIYIAPRASRRRRQDI